MSTNPSIRFSAPCPISADRLWQMRHGDRGYSIVSVPTKDPNAAGVLLANITPDHDGGDYTRPQIGQAKLVMFAGSLARDARSLCDAYASHDGAYSVRMRGDERKTVEMLRECAAFVSSPEKRQPDVVDQPAHAFREEFEALKRPDPYAVAVAARPFSLNLPFRMQGAAGEDGPWLQSYDSTPYSLLEFNVDAFNSGEAKGESEALQRSVEVAPYLLLGSLRLVDSARMERSLYDLGPHDQDHFHREASRVDESLGNLIYPGISKTIGGARESVLFSQRNHLAGLAAQVIEQSNGRLADSPQLVELKELVGGLTRGPGTEIHTQDELDDMSVSKPAPLAEDLQRSAHAAVAAPAAGPERF